MGCNSKIVVFDLDETLGYFTELGMFWDALKGYIHFNKINIPIDQHLFNKILDLYPEFLRPNIINILSYLKKKKQQNHCDKLMIYTNNQGPKEWAKYIMGYFETKIKYKLFDQLLSAFKVNGKKIELCRTTHEKTHGDLLRCTDIPENTRICFLDDVFYPGMNNDNIYYINIKPYTHDLTFDLMITRFVESGILPFNTNSIDAITCREYILTYMKRYNYSYVEKNKISQSIDKVLSKTIMRHLRIFFENKNNNTKKHKRVKNKTLKRL
jgi:hypothetical protein